MNALESNIGKRHGNSNACFVYILDPDDPRIERYCSDGQTVDPDLEPIKRGLQDPQRRILWRAPALESWFEHGLTFAEGQTRDSRIIAP